MMSKLKKVLKAYNNDPDEEHKCQLCKEHYTLEIGYELSVFCNSCAHEVIDVLMENYYDRDIF